MTSLKSFIKAVRASKTLADERAVIQKESAAIRTSFRDNYTDQSTRRTNVAKLLYLFTLGERTHFGQVECLKLLATSKFTDKRLGYLGTMLLLDENQETLTLVTNSLSNDLAHSNQYVVALALCTLGNIASQEMARDVNVQIEKIISSSNSYLKKKAALCAMRLIRRVPDLEDGYIDKAKLLLNEKNHGALLCGASLITDMCDHNPEVTEHFTPLVPTIIKQLKQLSSSGYAPEHDVTGIADPFLQVKLLRLLRILGANDSNASEKMSDILAQVASNTDGSKNVGNSVLYEAVLTIFGIEADSGLRVLAVNILGKFLATKDNNTKYVALNTLLKVIEVEPTAVQRHRTTILDCLHDADISIRRRALELSYALINEQNIRVLVRELLAFLETADNEFKMNLVSQIAMSAESFAPNKRWHIDTILRTLKSAGNHTKENVLSAFITLVITCDEQLQLYTVQKLYAALKKDITQQGLTLVGCWLIGEYGSMLLKAGNFNEDDELIQVNETEVVNLLNTIIDSSYATDNVKEYVANSLMKLSVRISNAGEVEKIRRLLESRNKSLDIELQQRVAEYGKLFNHDSVRRGVLEKMPAPEFGENLNTRYQAEKAKKKSQVRPTVKKTNASSQPASDMDLLLDLTGDDAGSTTTQPQQQSSSNVLEDIFSSSSSTSPPAASTTTSTNKNQSILDLFDSPAPAPTAPSVSPTVSTPAASSNMDDLLGLGSGAPVQQSSSSPQPAAEEIEAYNNNGLKVTFTPQAKTPSPGTTTITTNFYSTGSGSTLSNLNLQVAVPRSQKLQLQAISKTTIADSTDIATQVMRINGDSGTAVKLRLKISFNSDTVGEVSDQVTFNNFPAGLL